METISRWLLTFLLNSLWQVAVVAGVAALACRFLRRSPASHWHAVWVTGLLLAMLLPVSSVRQAAPADEVQFIASAVDTGGAVAGPARTTKLVGTVATAPAAVRPSVSLAQRTAWVVLGAYFLFVLVGLGRLVRATGSTLRLRGSAVARPIPERLERVLRRCEAAFGLKNVRLLFSAKLSGPVTAGGAIVLPESLVDEMSEEVLATAIGHEMAHLARRDFGWNVVYELLYVPIGFHPAVWLIRRSIARTREMACDEMVTRRLMDAGVYARSIVSIATAMTAAPSPGYSLGVFDGDILEARIRRLMDKPAASLQRARILLVSGLAAIGVCAIVASGLSFTARAQGGASEMIKAGQEAYGRGDYKAAASRFDAAVRAEPDNVEARLMLAKSLMQQFVPNEPAAAGFLAGARKQFEEVLLRDARNTGALHGMMIVGMDARQFAEAKEWAQKTIASDSTDASAYYVTGVADWNLAFGDYMKARKSAGMQPQDPGIIPDAALREQFKAQHMSQVEEGIRSLQTAIQIKPDYSDAFAFINLLYRIEAGVADDEATSLALTKTADNYVGQALAAKKKEAQSGRPSDGAAGMIAMPAPPPPPPPPPPPAGAGGGGSAMVQVKGSEQQARLVKQVAASGPAGVSGKVTLGLVVDQGGRVNNIWVVSGPPALAGPAMAAVRQWVYQPLLLNGAPVEVYTSVELSFSGQ